ncbi:MAG: efflux RND transporter periplasmic adaptor subunit, partial [Candidatus Cloacimonadaceae bacterium]
MRKKWIWIVGIVLVLIILVFALAQCGKKAMGKAMQAQGGDQHHIVARGDIESRIEITGEVQPQNLISLKSKVSGKIVKFYADENDFVRMGQIIADIEPDYN